MRKKRQREITLLENGGSGTQAQLSLSSEPLLFSLTTVLKHYVWSLASFWWRSYCTQVKMLGNGAADNVRWFWCYVWSFQGLNTVVVAGTKVNELIVLLALMQLFIQMLYHEEAEVFPVTLLKFKNETWPLRIRLESLTM